MRVPLLAHRGTRCEQPELAQLRIGVELGVLGRAYGQAGTARQGDTRLELRDLVLYRAADPQRRRDLVGDTRRDRDDQRLGERRRVVALRSIDRIAMEPRIW